MYKLVSVNRPGKTARYETVEAAKAALARLSQQYPTHDFRIFEVEEKFTLVYTTEKDVR